MRHFRHSFAVNALQRLYAQGADVQAKLPHLATYLGHANAASTHLPEADSRASRLRRRAVPPALCPALRRGRSRMMKACKSSTLAVKLQGFFIDYLPCQREPPHTPELSRQSQAIAQVRRRK